MPVQIAWQCKEAQACCYYSNLTSMNLATEVAFVLLLPALTALFREVRQLCRLTPEAAFVGYGW